MTPYFIQNLMYVVVTRSTRNWRKRAFFTQDFLVAANSSGKMNFENKAFSALRAVSKNRKIGKKTIDIASCPIHLYLMFEKSSWKNPVRQTGFLIFFELHFHCLCRKLVGNLNFKSRIVFWNIFF
jgi:hypothetical protein